MAETIYREERGPKRANIVHTTSCDLSVLATNSKQEDRVLPAWLRLLNHGSVDSIAIGKWIVLVFLLEIIIILFDKLGSCRRWMALILDWALIDTEACQLVGSFGLFLLSGCNYGALDYLETCDTIRGWAY